MQRNISIMGSCDYTSSQRFLMSRDPISEPEKPDLEEADEDEAKAVRNKNLLRLAELSLEDYEWRQSVFKTNEADRRVEESLARMMGDEASYVRPMDASTEKIGPLVSSRVFHNRRSILHPIDLMHWIFGTWQGLLEKSSVDWLRNVIEEEARRAKKIVRFGGMMVRPIESATPDGELGPLGLVEKSFVDFLEKIRRSERARSTTKTLRPKDLDESERGPLGEAELKAIATINEILASEKLR
eukprot:scaffold23739_cov162-Cylindrotheca_fusiformis.AAC.1